MKGKMSFGVMKGDRIVKIIRLTVCCDEDYADSRGGGLSEIRRRRIQRLLREAATQGVRLTYGDLAVILLSSRSTIKRDMNVLKKNVGRDRYRTAAEKGTEIARNA